MITCSKIINTCSSKLWRGSLCNHYIFSMKIKLCKNPIHDTICGRKLPLVVLKKEKKLVIEENLLAWPVR